MIPLRDDAPRVSFPVVTLFLIAINALTFLFEQSLSRPAYLALLYQFGVVPGAVIQALQRTAGVSLATAVVPFFTSMFLHASWWHIIGNMWALWIFGDNVEDRLGHGRYLLLYFIAGLAGGIVQVMISSSSTFPVVGASGAIAGVMGAYFLLFPHARVLVFVFTLIWLPAWAMLGYWFLVQFIGGAADSIHGANAQGGVAVWAHVGGFIAGISLVKLLARHAHQYSFER